MLSRAVSILHLAKLLRLRLLQALCVCSLAGLLPSTLSLWAGGELCWETSLAQAGSRTVHPWSWHGAGLELCLICATWKSATKSCYRHGRLWLFGASPCPDPWGWHCPRGRPEGWHCCGEARAPCLSIPVPVPPSHRSMFFPRHFRPLTMPRHGHVLPSPNSDSPHHVAWSEIVAFMFCY